MSRSVATTVARPFQLLLVLVKPSGARIENVDVSVSWEGTPPFTEAPKTQSGKTDAQGKFSFGVIETVDGSPVTGTVECRRRCHGPVVLRREVFKNGPASIQVRVNGGSLELPELEGAQDDLVRWGKPRVILVKEGKLLVPALEVMLVEGGTLGVEHSSTRTRRLSSPYAPKDPPKPEVSQVDEELIYHIAHGDLALTAGTDYQFQHESESADCTNGRCKLILRTSPFSASDPPLGDAEAPFVHVPKVSVRNEVMGGVRFMNLRAANAGPPSKRQFQFGPSQTTSLNPRNVVGAVRLGIRLSELAGTEVRVVLTSGFLRNFEARHVADLTTALAKAGALASPETIPGLGKLKLDAHGRGRAIDVSGLMLDHPPDFEAPEAVVKSAADPNARRKKGAKDAKPYVPERDFSVNMHWGNLEMVILDDGNERRVQPPFDKKKDGTKVVFHNEFKPNPGLPQLVYRLGIPWDLTPEDQLPKRAVGHEMTPQHYKLAAFLFGEVYGFFVREYSCRDKRLGPVDRAGFSDEAEPIALQDDAGGVSEDPGLIEGQVLHPDTPDSAARRNHQDHIHANLGHNGPGSENGHVWALASRKEREEALVGGYEL